MKFDRVSAVAGLLATVSLLAGCVQPELETRSQVVERQVAEKFGGTSISAASDIYEEYDEDAKGFNLYRVYSELPFPNRFTTQVPENFANTLVVDAAVEFRADKGYPLYRIGLRPRKIGLEAVRSWPGYVKVTSADDVGKEVVLIAKLPENRALDKNGFMFSEWTYCSSCFNLERVAKAHIKADHKAFDLIERANHAANSASAKRSGFEGAVTLIEYPVQGIRVADEALRLSSVANAELSLARHSLSMLKPAREQYFAFARDYAADKTALNVGEQKCGIYQPPVDYRPDIALERERNSGFIDCYASVLETYDQEQRAKRIYELESEEIRLATAGAIGHENRIHIKPVGFEVEALRRLALKAEFDFADWSLRNAGGGVVYPSPAIAAEISTIGAEPHATAVTATVLAAPAPNANIEIPLSSETSTSSSSLPAAPAVPAVEPEIIVAPAITPPEKLNVPSAVSAGERVGEPMCAIMMLCPDRK